MAQKALEAAARRAPMCQLLEDLDAFYLEHRRCGELDAGVDDGMWA